MITRRSFVRIALGIAAAVTTGALGLFKFKPKPHEFFCPVCGSPGVDIDDGKMTCNGCYCEMTFGVSLEYESFS